jgi:hypothetical protein
MKPLLRLFACAWLYLAASSLLFACSGVQAASLPTPALPSASASTQPVSRLPTATPFIFQLKPSSTPLPSPTPFSPEFQQGYGPDNFPPQVNPLTGLEVSDPGLLERRPLAIKVTNFFRSVRPQWGLSQADNVFEYYLEDGMTRFIAIFYGNDADRVGPIRSARFFDEHIARMYHAYLTFSGADPRVINPWLESDLKPFLVIPRPDNCPPLCRIGPDWNYNTMFANTQQLSEYVQDWSAGNQRQNLDGLRFDPYAPYSDETGEVLSVFYSRVSYNKWEYDPFTGRYVRFQEEADAEGDQEFYAPLNDSASGQQLAADNVIVLLVPHEYFIHTTTTEMVKMNFFGQGQAYAFREGKLHRVTWMRNAPDQIP